MSQGHRDWSKFLRKCEKRKDDFIQLVNMSIEYLPHAETVLSEENQSSQGDKHIFNNTVYEIWARMVERMVNYGDTGKEGSN